MAICPAMKQLGHPRQPFAFHWQLPCRLLDSRKKSGAIMPSTSMTTLSLQKRAIRPQQILAMLARFPSCAASSPRMRAAPMSWSGAFRFDAAVSNRPGARFGPQAIRRASAIFDNEPQISVQPRFVRAVTVIDYGDCLLDFGNHQKTPAAIEKQAAKILKSGAFLYSMGGDHYVTWRSSGSCRGPWPMALVHFDAHQDTWFDDGKRIDHGRLSPARRAKASSTPSGRSRSASAPKRRKPSASA